jgi:GNAT superfamily N-acetyltransferase
VNTTYIIQDGTWCAAIADTSPCEDQPNRRIVNRINVTSVYRGRGYGSQILQMLLKVADKEGITLTLSPVATGGLSQRRLVNWYKRHGFQWEGKPGFSMMTRAPCS